MGITLAPSLFVVEAANLVFKYHRDGLIEDGLHTDFFQECLNLVDLFLPSEDLASEALTMACNNQKPVYDYFYLVLARRNSAKLLTLDKGLMAEARKHGVKV